MVWFLNPGACIPTPSVPAGYTFLGYSWEKEIANTPFFFLFQPVYSSPITLETTHLPSPGREFEPPGLVLTAEELNYTRLVPFSPSPPPSMQFLRFLPPPFPEHFVWRRTARPTTLPQLLPGTWTGELCIRTGTPHALCCHR